MSVLSFPAKPLPLVESKRLSREVQIAAEQLADDAVRLARITRSFVTPAAQAQAEALRKNIERQCATLRRLEL